MLYHLEHLFSLLLFFRPPKTITTLSTSEDLQMRHEYPVNSHKQSRPTYRPGGIAMSNVRIGDLALKPDDLVIFIDAVLDAPSPYALTKVKAATQKAFTCHSLTPA